MTLAEHNLWRLAELAVKNGNAKEVFDELQSKGTDTQTLMLFTLYEHLIRAGQKVK
jgi:hypothetical protein